MPYNFVDNSRVYILADKPLMLPAGRRQSSPESHKHMPYGRQKNLSTYEFHETDKEIFAPAQYLREHPRVVFTNCAIKERRMSAVSSFLLLFAIVEGVVSFVLPIVDAFGPPKHIQHKFYLEVFKLLQFMVSIVALTYLQAPILYYKRQFQDHEIHLRERKPLNKSDCNVTQNDHINYKREESQVDFIDVDNSADVSDSNEQNNRFKCQHNEESRCENPSNTHGVKRGFLSQKKEISEDGKRAESSEPLHDANKLELLGLLVKRRIHTIGRMFGDRTTTDRKRNPPPIECEQGNNLYLRLGAVVFGFGVMIMDGFRVADQFDSLNAALSCHSAFWIPVNVIHSIYIFWQTYFLFKHHHVVFNVKKFFVRFILAHMTVVNLGQWMGTIVQEVMISDKEEGNTSALNVSALSALIVSKNLNLTTNLYAQCKSQVGIFAHYLIPCGVEYSLIACAIFYKMFRRVGHITRSEVEPQCVISSSTADEGARSAYECLLRNNPTECQHGHKGLFAGLLLVMTTLVAMALFYTHLQRSSQVEALTLFQGTYIVLLSIGILAVSIALFQVRVLGARQMSEDSAFDDYLLLIGLLGILFYNMFLLAPAMEGIESNKIARTMFMSKSVLEILQALMQVFLILEASCSQASSTRQVIEKPGRTVITFLLILNLAMWMVTTFGLKHAEGYSIHRSHYSDIAWKIITHLSMPLIVFFRFHSTVCLADVWSNAYRIHKPTIV